MEKETQPRYRADKVYRNELRGIEKTATNDGNYYSAILTTPHGTARLFAQDNSRKSHFKYSNVEFIYNGKMHNWWYKEFYTPLGLARKAGKLIKELAK